MMAATAGAVAVLSLIIVLGNAFKQIFEFIFLLYELSR